MTADLFATAVKRSIAGDLSVNDLLVAVEGLRAGGETVLMLELYRTWLAHNTANPLAYAIQFNLGTALSDAKDLAAAKEAFEAALRLQPGFLPALINLGGVLERMGHADQAIARWSEAADSLAHVSGESIMQRTTALKQIGRVLETSRIEARAEEVLRLSLDINPRQRDVIQHWIALRQVQCKWPVFAPEVAVPAAELMQAISPLSLAVYCDDPIFQLASAHHYNKRDVKSRSAAAMRPAATRPRDPARRLRIGYVSSDLREHAVGFLMSEVFELHDRDAVEAFAYYCGIAATDRTQERFKASVEHWTDINGLSDEEAAARIEADGIDILVDLNGYTKDARLNLIALRPAPVIVNWLGFPGTMGSPYHNYIVADPVTIPEGSESFYSEKVVRLPCYQPNDRKRVVADMRPTRAEAGLPETAFVYCCFNGTQKITKPTFDAWTAILKRTPESVLWLLTGTAETNEHLKDLAEQAGIARDRIVFAPRKSNPDHLARYPLADLFLDTFPYGAHTTASDALFMGVPVLTVPGQSFASRVCASLVTAAGLDDLVCPTWDAFMARAAELAADRSALAALKARLAAGRDTCTLFDVPRLVRSLERLYREMWADYVAGELHRPDLSNLELLHEIGCGLDRETGQGRLATDYRALYRQACLERHAFAATEHDPRLAEAVEMQPEAMDGASARSGRSARASGSSEVGLQ